MYFNPLQGERNQQKEVTTKRAGGKQCMETTERNRIGKKRLIQNKQVLTQNTNTSKNNRIRPNKRSNSRRTRKVPIHREHDEDSATLSYCWVTRGARGSSIFRLKQPHKWVRLHIFIRNLKATTFLSNVRLITQSCSQPYTTEHAV